MPALRGFNTMAPRTRRRSSLAFTPTKPGVYSPPQQHPHPHPHHLSHLPPRPISFAPNVTPVSYNANSSDEDLDDDALNTPPQMSPRSQQPKLFPPSDKPAPPAQRKRCPPGRRRSQGYIPRPPNAFMLFRADFVRQKHVPGSIETNHTSLSKIIGNCWRNLPLDEKKVWEHRAKIAKNDHKAAYPDYRFRPVHKKSKKLKAALEASRGATPSSTSKSGKTQKVPDTFEEEMRCEEVTQLLLQGLKGEELRNALDELEKQRGVVPPPQSHSLSHPSQAQHPSTHLTHPSQAYAQDNGSGAYAQDVGYGQDTGYATQDGAAFVLEHDSAAYGGYAPPTQMMQALHLQESGGVGYAQEQDPYALQHHQHQSSQFPQHLQLDAGGNGGMYAGYEGGGASPSTAAGGGSGSGQYSGVSAPQPTYPTAAGSLFGLAGNQGVSGVGGNVNGGGWSGMYNMQRRPSSVPALPSGFGGWGGDWDMGAVDDAVLGTSSSSLFGGPFQQQHQSQEGGVAPNNQPEHQQQQPHPHTSDGITIPSVPFLAPPSSAGIISLSHYAADLSFGAGRRMSLAQRMALGHRRSSSAGAAFGGGGMRGQGWGGFGVGGEGMSGFGWAQSQGEGGMREIQRDDSELPEADLSLFDPSFLSSGVSRGQEGGAPHVEDGKRHVTPSPPHPFTTTELYQHLPPGGELGPLDVGPGQHSQTLSQHSNHSHSHSNSNSHSNSHHSNHPSMDNANSLQFAASDVPPNQSIDSRGQQGKGVSPVERYEQMYLAERGAYNVSVGLGGEYGLGGYEWGV